MCGTPSVSFGLSSDRTGAALPGPARGSMRGLVVAEQLATETTDPVAERLMRAMIAELEDRLMADSSHSKSATVNDADQS